MNETELLARLREEIPFEEISPRAERLFLAGLEHAPGEPGSARRRLSRWRGARRPRLAGWLTLTGGLSAAVAAALIAAAVMTAPQPGRAGSTMTVRELAYRVAAAAGRQPQIRPGQWVYWKEATSTAKTSTFEVWTTADPTKAAFLAHGKLYALKISLFPLPGEKRYKIPGQTQYIGQPEGTVIPPADRTPGGPRPDFTGETGTIPVSYAELGSLPRRPGALDRYLAGLKLPHVSLFGSPPAREFLFIEEMIASYVMPPRLTAELYRALAEIPGVVIDEHAVDYAGRHGIGFVSPPAADGGTDELIINPRTYRLMGDSGLGPRHNLVYGTAILRQALVSGPGVRP